MEKETKYTVDYFIEKFSAIPEEMWTVGETEDIDGKKCALGFCSLKSANNSNKETKSLCIILKPYLINIAPFRTNHILNEEIWYVNDRMINHNRNPKKNILDGLMWVKDNVK